MTTVAVPELVEAHEPPEVHGTGRDDVALLVADRTDGSLVHARFDELPGFLAEGNLLVVNNSGTLPAALPARLAGRDVELRLSTPAAGGAWVVEVRDADGSPLRAPRPGARLELPGGAHADLLAPFAGSDRLAVARLHVEATVEEYLASYGHAIRYSYVPEEWPLEAYQTIFAREPGSAEMPSAGRPFTAEIVSELVSRGILIAPVTLHTGVSSPELGEPPYPERFLVSDETARIVNAARASGGRVIAVGTTVVRALETAASSDGAVKAGQGWTSLVVTPETGVRVVDGLLTGWHEPQASHLQMLEAIAGPELLDRSYAEARGHGYRWHEFGDVHLIV